MKRLLHLALVTAALTVLPYASPAEAAAGKPCLQEAIDSCNADFPGGGIYASALRGWCYIIRGGLCALE